MPDATRSTQPLCFLFDNGSLRPESTFSLRRISAGLAAKLGDGVEVRPVSLLHSSGIEPSLLSGRGAQLLEPALAEAVAKGVERAVLLPLFFGPSRALTEYVPERVAAVAVRAPGLRVVLAAPLVDLASDTEDRRIATILADAVRTTATSRRWQRPHVILVDHGSPQPAVSAVRNHLGSQLAELLGDAVSGVRVASMERRDGAEYDHTGPLLEAVLGDASTAPRETVIAMQFLQPGRHAGPGGDVASLCARAEAGRPGLVTAMTSLVGEGARLVDVLADRYRAAAVRLA